MKRLLVIPLLVCALACALPLLGQGEENKPTRKAAASAKAAAGDPAQGKQVYKGKCAICHFDTSTTERVGPGMKGLFKAEKLPKSGLAPTEENVRKLVLEGSATMQPFRGALTRQQMDDLIAYLKTL